MSRSEMEQVWQERFVRLVGAPIGDDKTVHRIMGEMVAYRTNVPMQPVAILRVETLFTHEIRSPASPEWQPCHEVTPQGCATCQGLLPSPPEPDVLMESIERTQTTIWKRLADLSRDAEAASYRLAQAVLARLMPSQKEPF